MLFLGKEEFAKQNNNPDLFSSFLKLYGPLSEEMDDP